MISNHNQEVKLTSMRSKVKFLSFVAYFIKLSDYFTDETVCFLPIIFFFSFTLRHILFIHNTINPMSKNLYRGRRRLTKQDKYILKNQCLI